MEVRAIFKRRSLIPWNSRIVAILVAVALLGGVLWWGLSGVDWEAPQVQLAPPIQVFGPQTTLTLTVQDKPSGLRHLRVQVRQAGVEKVVLEQSYPERVYSVALPLTLKPAELGLQEGPVELTVTARDYSWWGWCKGRETTLTRRFTVDLTPLQVAVRSLNHTLNQGGTGLVIYQVNKKPQKSGIWVNGEWFAGYPVPGGESGCYLAFFAVPYEMSVPLALEVRAGAAGGTEVRKQIPYRLKRKTWRQDRINLSEDFLRQKMPEFQALSAGLQNPGDPLAVFLAINQKRRQSDHQRVKEICSHSRPERLWRGPFLRLPNSKPMAGFADHRTYYYQGQKIDHQIHLGQDLASLQQAEVPAANHGVVVLAEPLGIYGQTVILDHGWGLFSMYSHLSRMQVQSGQQVKRGEVIGRTGATGLAGGDHLHFSVIVQGQFVNPVEWWDAHWIKDNIERQLKAVRSP